MHDTFGTVEIRIYVPDKNSHSEYIDSENIWYYDHKTPMAKAVMKVATLEKTPHEFDCNNEHYTLLCYSYNCYEKIYNENRIKYVKNNTVVYLPKEIIYVYSMHCRCVRCYKKYGFDAIENICAEIPLKKNNNNLISVDMQKCTHCNRYFIDNQSLALYEEKYGTIDLPKHEIKNILFQEDLGREHAPDSILSRNGYSANLKDHERKDILVRIMQSGNHKAEIKGLLSSFIRTRKNCTNALLNWENDLEFVNDYNLNDENKVHFF